MPPPSEHLPTDLKASRNIGGYPALCDEDEAAQESDESPIELGGSTFRPPIPSPQGRGLALNLVGLTTLGAVCRKSSDRFDFWSQAVVRQFRRSSITFIH